MKPNKNLHILLQSIRVCHFEWYSIVCIVRMLKQMRFTPNALSLYLCIFVSWSLFDVRSAGWFQAFMSIWCWTLVRSSLIKRLVFIPFNGVAWFISSIYLRPWDWQKMESTYNFNWLYPMWQTKFDFPNECASSYGCDFAAQMMYSDWAVWWKTDN